MKETTDNPTAGDRRERTDRRVSGDRRRGAEGRYAVIEICRSQVHLAVVAPETRGDSDLLLCRSLNWRVESASLLEPQGAEELRIAMKQLAVEERLAGVATTVLLNGGLCVSRVVIGPSTKVDGELAELADRSQLYLTLGSGEKAAATSRFALDARHEHAVYSVANRHVIDAVVGAAESAGLELQSVEASTAAICRAHGEFYDDDNPALLVQLDEDSVDIVLSHRGRLLLEHRIGGQMGPEKFAEVLEQHRERLVRYCRRQRIEGDLQRVLLTGEEELFDAAKRGADRNAIDVELFDTGRASGCWALREGTPSPDHAAVIGGALRTLPSSGASSGPNLLERWIAESRKHIRPMLLRSAAPLAAVLLLAVGMAVASYSLGRENAELERQIAALAEPRARANALRLKLISTRLKTEELRRLADETPQTHLVDFLTGVTGCLPNDVWLEQLQLSNGREVAVTGASYTESGAYDFVGHLNKAPGMRQVALQETRPASSANGPTTAFRIQASYSAAEPSSPAENDESERGRQRPEAPGEATRTAARP